ncbi:MAG: hypothetical protein PHN31_06565 [Candidatus Gracilibacteria bacterium]|nr:hypothetical protein [Candidatus Gracilibacteria bacterium]
MKKNIIDLLTQILLPSLTILSQIFVALKYPQYGVLVNLLAQPFWLYSSWKAYKEAGQIGILITTIIIIIVLSIGMVNYFILK